MSGEARRPLEGVGVIVTRPARQGARLATRLSTLGARPIVWPAVVILPPHDAAPLARVHAQLPAYDIAVFVSPNAVEYGAPDPARWPAGLRIFTPGVGSAEAVEAVGLPAATVPRTSFDSTGLLELPELHDVAGKRVIVFRGEDGRGELGDTLRARGASVEYVSCYRREVPQGSIAGLVAVLARGEAHALSLTSVEGLANLVHSLGGDAWRLRPLRAFAPHPRIAAAARTAGLDTVETPPGDGGLVTALLEWFGSHPVPVPGSP